jgi:hypothetical protein
MREIASMARLAPVLALAPLFYASLATAQIPGGEEVWDGGYEVKSERRSDFALGIGTGLAMGEGHGVMNEVEQLNDDSFEQSTGFAVGSDLDVWLGGAIRDWFAVGVGVSMGSSQGNGILVARQGFLLRLDVYPAYSLGGAWRDLGVALDGGVGGLLAVDAKDTDQRVFEGGSVSAVGAGVFWEGLRFARGHFGSGPTLHYRLLSGLPSTAHTVTLGMRLTFYSGPKRRKADRATAQIDAPEVPRGLF